MPSSGRPVPTSRAASDPIRPAAPLNDAQTALLRLELAVDAAAIGAFDWDLATGELAWDERMRRLMASDAEVEPSVDEFHPGHPSGRPARSRPRYPTRHRDLRRPARRLPDHRPGRRDALADHSRARPSRGQRTFPDGRRRLRLLRRARRPRAGGACPRHHGHGLRHRRRRLDRPLRQPGRPPAGGPAPRAGRDADLGPGAGAGQPVGRRAAAQRDGRRRHRPARAAR